MQFMVRIVVRLPGDWPKEKVDELAARETARGMQQERFAKHAGVHANSSMTPRLIKKHCELDAEARQAIHAAIRARGPVAGREPV